MKKKVNRFTEQYIRTAYAEHYKTIANTGSHSSIENEFHIRFTNSYNVRAASKTHQHGYTNGWGGTWFYWTAEFWLTISKKQKLPMFCDDIMNLYSKLHEKYKIKGKIVPVYRATWIHHGQGTRIRKQSGYIAKGTYKKRKDGPDHSVYYHHISDPLRAARGALRKIEKEKEIAKDIRANARYRKEEVVLRKLDQKKFKKKIPEDVTVNYAKAKKAGMCSYGIDGFAERHNLNKNKSYPARKIYSLEPDNYEVKKVVLYAMRLYRRTHAEPLKRKPVQKSPGNILGKFWRGMVRRVA